MQGQLDIFSFLQAQSEEKYCFDDDINEIHKKLIDISKKYGIQLGRDRFSIWSHVPQYGYRMDFEMKITKEDSENLEFQKDIDEIVIYAKEREVELSPMLGAVFFFKGKDTATLSFYTTFMDKKRRKIK